MGNELNIPEYASSIPEMSNGAMMRQYYDKHGMGLFDYIGAHARVASEQGLLGNLKSNWNTLQNIGQEISYNEETQSFDEGMANLKTFTSEDEWKKSEFYRYGMKYTPGITQAEAAENADAYDRRTQAQFIIDESPMGIRSVAGLVTDLAVGMLDPINYIPFVGAAGKGVTIAADLGESALKRAGLTLADRVGSEAVSKSMFGSAFQSGADAMIGATLGQVLEHDRKMAQGEVFTAEQVFASMATSFLAGFGIRLGMGALSKLNGAVGEKFSIYMKEKQNEIIAEQMGVHLSPERTAQIKEAENELRVELAKIDPESANKMDFETKGVDVVEHEAVNNAKEVAESGAVDKSEEVSKNASSEIEAQVKQLEVQSEAGDAQQRIEEGAKNSTGTVNTITTPSPDPVVSRVAEQVKNLVDATNKIMERCL